MEFVRKHLGSHGIFEEIPAMKFMQLISPGDVVQLEIVRTLEEKGEVFDFQYSKENEVASKGKIKLRTR